MQIDFYTNVARFGNNIHVRGVFNGKERRFKVPYSPTIYLENDKQDYGFRSLYGKNLKPIVFDKIKEAQEFAEEHKHSNLNVYGFPNFASQYALENYSDTVSKFDKSFIRIWNIDIEVTSNAGFPNAEEAAFPITALCVYDNMFDTFMTFGIGEWEQNDSILPDEISDKVKYVACKDELDLMKKFIQFWTTFTPNIVTGWNVAGFDMPYLINRIENIGLDKRKLSPWNYVDVRNILTSNGTPDLKPNIMGVDVIDYLLLYKKNKTQDSYRLDNIARLELGENKSLGTVEMLDMSRVPFIDTPSNNVYEMTDDEEFNRFARLRKERVETQVSNNDNKDLEVKLLLEQEKKAAFQAFISYNIQDVNLVKRLDEKMGLIDAHIMIAYESCMNFEDVSSPVKTWDCLINKEMYRNKQIPHFHIEKAGDHASIPGGHVKEPQIGKHGWCVSFDLNSLYPHLIMQFNISPETLDESFRLWTDMVTEEDRVKRLLNKDEILSDMGGTNTDRRNEGKTFSISAGGYRFNNEFEGIIPRLMRKMYEDRKSFKKQMIAKQKRGEDANIENLRQYVLKILLNSGYGAFINKYFRWFDVRLGKAITLSGQFVIQAAEKAINDWMNKVLKTDGVDYIIAIDTDSNYVNFQPMVDKFFADKSKEELVDIIDKIAEEQVQKILENAFQDVATYLNAFEQKMVMEREAIASSAFWTAKKRYAMAVHDLEGVRMPIDKPKLKIQGLEAIRSSTPILCRQPLLDVIEKTLMEDEESVQKFISDFKDEFLSFGLMDISMPRTMNNMQKFIEGSSYRKGTPIHIRGAIAFNNMLKKHNLENVWESLQSGEKGRFVYLMEPNSVGENVISFVNGIPNEFDINKYIDKNKMFEKIILDPVSGILEPIGWSVEKKLTLESFFG